MYHINNKAIRNGPRFFAITACISKHDLSFAYKRLTAWKTVFKIECPLCLTTFSY